MSSFADTISSIPSRIHSAAFEAADSFASAAASASAKIRHNLVSLSERIQFFIEFLKDPLANGSIMPSSAKLTEKVIQFIPEKSEITSAARRYLEVGAGTGSFTTGIAERLNPNDILDIVELNPTFCTTLSNKFAAYPNVRVHCASITDWNPEEQYDDVISGLPLNAFPVSLVEECFNVFKKVTKPGGTISYFEYPNVSEICLFLYHGEKKETLEKVLEIKAQFFNTYGFQSEIVEDNFPMAKALHFRMRKLENDPDNKAPTVSTLPDAS